MPRSVAISLRLFQNSSSRLTLVLCPAITIERLETEDFTAFPLDYVTTVSVSTLGLLVCRSLGFKPVRDKPQYASNGDERPNRENSGQLAVLQAIQTQPQPSQHNEWGYEYTCNTLRFVVHFLRVAQKLITSLKVLVPGLVLRLRFDLIFTQRLA
jgi:hypothetical protein